MWWRFCGLGLGLGLGLGGCDLVFHVYEVEPTPAIDAAAPDAPGCYPGAFRDLLTSDTAPCAPWAFVAKGASGDTIAESAGVLTITNQAPSVYSGCEANYAMVLDPRGIFVRADTLPTDPTAYASLMIHDANNQWRISLNYAGGQLHLTENSSTDLAVPQTYDASTMAFWRLRADSTAMTYVAEYSPDAVTWTELGRTAHMFDLANMIRLRLSAGISATVGSATTQFSHLNVCP